MGANFTLLANRGKCGKGKDKNSNKPFLASGAPLKMALCCLLAKYAFTQFAYTEFTFTKFAFIELACYRSLEKYINSATALANCVALGLQRWFEVPVSDLTTFQKGCLLKRGKSGVNVHRVRVACKKLETWSKDPWITSPNLSNFDDALAELANRVRYSTVETLILNELVLHPVHAQVSGAFTGGLPFRHVIDLTYIVLSLEPARDGSLIPTRKLSGNCCLRLRSSESGPARTADRLLSSQSSAET